MVLGTGALLDAWGRVFGVPSSLVICLTGFLSIIFFFPTGDKRHSDYSNSQTSEFGNRTSANRLALSAGLSGSFVLLLAELARVGRRPFHSGFPFWLSDLFHEDNSSWVAFGTSSLEGSRLPSLNFGHGFALIQGSFNGLGTLYGAVRGISHPAVGTYVSGVGFAYTFLVVTTPCLTVPLMRMVQAKGDSLASTIAFGVAVNLFLLRFMQEARDLGHLSAGYTVFALLCSVNLFCSYSPLGVRALTQSGAVWALSFSCLLWFPLRPLALVFGVIAAFMDFRVFLKSRGMEAKKRYHYGLLFRGVIFGWAVVARSMPDLQSYMSPASRERTRALINADGGTYEPVDFFVIAAATLTGSVLLSKKFGTRIDRLFLALFALYTIGIRFSDQIGSPTFEYGSTKLFWIFTPLIVFFALHLLVRDYSVSSKPDLRAGGAFIVAGLLFMNTVSFYGVVRLVGPLVWAEVRGTFAVGSSQTARDSVVQWDEPGGLDLTASPLDLPVLCVSTDSETAPLKPLWDFEPYRCTRKLSEISLEHQRSQAVGGADELWKSYALLDASLGEAVFGTISSGTNLARPALILDPSGRITRSEKLVDLLAQIALTDTILVQSARQMELVGPGDAQYSLDKVDLGRGQIHMWVDNTVVRILLVGESNNASAQSTSVERFARVDVAERLGRSNLYSGISLVHPAVNQGLRCIVLYNRAGEATIVEVGGEKCA